MANDETKFPPNKFSKIFQQLHENGVNVTIHSAEVDVPEACNNLQVSVKDLRKSISPQLMPQDAKRIGHGIFCVKDLATVQFVKNQGVVLEVCPYSNWLTGACKTLADHPLPKLLSEGVKVTISTGTCIQGSVFYFDV